MKSKTAKDLMSWLESGTRIIDWPRDFTKEETKRIVNIAEDEIMGINVSEKVNQFKKDWYKDCDIKSVKVTEKLNEMESHVDPFYSNFLLAEHQVIEMIEMAENELTVG